MKRILIPSLVAAAAIAGCSDDPPTGVATAPDQGPAATARGDHAVGFGVPATTRTYEITLENLTPATGAGSSQVFSPPVIATHNPSVRLFRVGRFASAELAQIAEDAVNGPMLEKLAGSHRVHESFTGDGVIPPGASATYTVHTVAGAGHLSMAFMLVSTNDAFSGVDAIHLPKWGEATHDLAAYDAGSEENTELASDIPGPCCGSPLVRVPTHERIHHHAGLQGTGDLDPEVWGWEGPVARLTVRRLAPAFEVVVENLTPATG